MYYDDEHENYLQSLRKSMKGQYVTVFKHLDSSNSKKIAIYQ